MEYAGSLLECQSDHDINAIALCYHANPGRESCDYCCSWTMRFRKIHAGKWIICQRNSSPSRRTRTFLRSEYVVAPDKSGFPDFPGCFLWGVYCPKKFQLLACWFQRAAPTFGSCPWTRRSVHFHRSSITVAIITTNTWSYPDWTVIEFKCIIFCMFQPYRQGNQERLFFHEFEEDYNPIKKNNY